MRTRIFALGAVSIACSSTPSPPPEDPIDFVVGVSDNRPCVLNCSPTCGEATAPWTCPALAEWSQIPHDPTACGSFDGTTYPAVVPGKCVATDPSGSALAKAQITTMPVVLPDGRRIQPAGNELVFEPDGGFPASQLLIPGTRFLAINDNGYDTQSIRIIDTARLKANSPGAEVARIAYPKPDGVNFGLAYLPAKKLLFASSATADACIFALDFDDVTGKITADAAKKISLPAGTLASGIDISPDGTTMLIGQSLGTSIFIISLADATYAQQLGTIETGNKDLYAIHFDPFDATGHTAYATMWTTALDFNDTSKMKLLQINVASKALTTIAAGKSPEEMIFLDARYALVANSLSDTISVVDRPAGQIVSTVPVSKLNGPSPTALAFDKTLSRLYVTLAGDNALAAFDVDTTQTPPTFTPSGAIPTAWWPTAVSVDPSDGAIYALTGRGHGIGTDLQQYAVGAADEATRMAGSVAAIAAPDAPALAKYTQAVTAQDNVAALDGYSTVQCNGAPYDFPISMKPEDGASTKIKHVFLIVRENKTFDYIMGAQPNVDGNPNIVLAPGNMDGVYPNAFAISSQFAQMDNYYTDAEQSVQGHAWTVFGRSTDYTERRWINIWGRYQYSIITNQPGVGEETTPAEGNIFEFLSNHGVATQNMGEFVGGLGKARDIHWPGGTSDGTIPDTLGACYAAARMRATCDPAAFTYMWLPNDHTMGLASGKPNPAVMIATNDEATGMFVDGLSHSPFWQDSLVVVVEDDPSNGGDHVDVHRSIALFASPWIKRNYVSHAHYDISSIHKLISDILGTPYRNETIANAALPLDLFTSTPDYTPFKYVPRKWTDISCNASGSTGAKTAEHWDFTEPDDQPGLDQQVWQALHALPRQH